MKFERIGHEILLSQPKHIEHGLKELGLMHCKPSQTPLTPNVKLLEASDEDYALVKKENVNYRSAIGLMNYIAGYTRPDISFAVSNLAQFSVKPGMQHWHKVRKVWQYLKHTQDLKLTLEIKTHSQLLDIYSDASWGDDPKHRTSQSGYICYLFGSPLIPFMKELGLRLFSQTYGIFKLTQQIIILTMKISKSGLNDKLKKFGSNLKTRHIDLKTKGMRQEVKAKNIKIVLI
ncbi:hypothetical protein VP01_1805g3 [Puccinia sorghi]|uniref:Reverse transcriptase Ty1/copia-type domain-containing protein n=1 Tax=Puccinia sorghi TaxID=27349 RepID=A0A0L6VET3_9BASI|nr:hypothetical protein VP01_1805g3 [Puccinia sorghi]